ncbi:hypothetical protein [Bacillus wiedmannii]|uniref:hypothetical protein n=1 Tax=Bacillus wiedmannii TaxID=1890302 RepID=UPI0007CAFC62|nr:hypothetical protein [Bacillus wiedmannii]OAK44504.1 hypothetical protein A6284_18150 [Bacillus wiedmannii]HDR7641194.1 hypothetical protein [Bacillus wiedmannii]
MSFNENESTISNLIDNVPSTQNWITSKMNGLIGEFRTKTLLLNNGFWVSERPLDTNGADFIIQKGELNKDLLHVHSPSLAFVQCKYISSTSTDIELDTKYIYNVNKKKELVSKNGFLLIIHHDDCNGKQHMKCLTAHNIDWYYKRGIFNDSLITSKNESELVKKVNITIKIKNLLNYESWDTEKSIIDKINKELLWHELISKINKEKFMGPEPKETDIEGNFRENSEIINALMTVRFSAYNLLEHAADYVVQLKRIINETDPYQYEDAEGVTTDIKYITQFKKQLCNESTNQLLTVMLELNEKINEYKDKHVQSFSNSRMDTLEHQEESSESE